VGASRTSAGFLFGIRPFFTFDEATGSVDDDGLGEGVGESVLHPTVKAARITRTRKEDRVRIQISSP
jgi:hypothetical protein